MPADDEGIVTQSELPATKRINAEAAQWFAERETGALSAEDEARFTRWLASDPRHARAFSKTEALWQSVDAPMLASAPLRPRFPWRRGAARSAPPERTHRRQWAGAAIAASLALLAVVGGDLPTRLQADAMTATGEIRNVRLPDGSVATLNTNSAIAFEPDGRTVRLLKGEANFQVRADPRHPFSVDAGDGVTTALGTRFIVRVMGDGARVTVTEHSVSVALGEKSLILRQGQTVRYNGHALAVPQPVAVADADAWLRGRIRVVNRPLREVVAELNRYHRGYIRVVDADIAKRLVSGTFDVRDPVAAVDVIQRTLGIGSTRLTNHLIFLHA